MSEHHHRSRSGSRHCPRCGSHTWRVRTPWYLRPVRWALPHRSSMRFCRVCGWVGFRVRVRGRTRARAA